MQLTLSKEHLLRALSAAGGPLAGHTTLPVLSHVALRTEGASLHLAATNLDQFVQAAVPAQISRGGELAVPGRKFTSIIRELASSEVVLAADDRHILTITCAGSRFELKGLARTEFPPAPTLTDPVCVTLTQPGLREMFRLTSFCASTDASRFILNGVLLDFQKRRLEMAATDGRRCAAVRNDTNLDTPLKVVVPSRAVAEVTRLLDDEGEVTLAVTDKKAEFRLGDVTFTTTLIEGSFPAYRQVFPAASASVELDRPALAAALRRVQLMSEVGSLNFRGSTLVIKARPTEKEQFGDAEETLETPTRPDLSIAFNLDYVLEPLQQLDDPTVGFAAADALAPAILTVPARRWEYVVMPIRPA